MKTLWKYKKGKNPYKLKISYQLIHLHAKYSRATDTKTAAIAALSAVVEKIVEFVGSVGWLVSLDYKTVTLNNL